MDKLDRKLLDLVQRNFPLIPQPFRELGAKLGLSEEEVLQRLRKLTQQGVLRQIGAIFNPQALGYRTSLVAFAVPKEKQEHAAQVINRHPGVSHNYLRDHPYNFWFTLAVPPERSLEEEVQKLASESQAQDFMILPVKRVFRIAVVFNLEEGMAGDAPNFLTPVNPVKPDPQTIRLVRATQEALPLTSRPFAEVAQKVNLSESELLQWIEKMLSQGVMRRFAGLVRHHRAGFRGNVMVAWEVPPDRLEEIGRALARQTGVTHCYERKTYPHWPYNLYTMIHGKDTPKTLERVKELAQKYQIPRYLPLKTLKEYKKVRLKLFMENNAENCVKG